MPFGKSIRKFLATTLAASCVATTTGCATVKTHPEFAQRHESIRRMAILPPDSQVMEVTFNAGNKPLAELTEVVKKHTTPAIAKNLKAKGYEVVQVKIEQKDLDSNAALRDAFFNIQSMYKKATLDIAKNKKPSFTYDIGSSANYFAEQHNVNALVITRQVGTKLSDGQVAAQVVSTTASIVTAALLGVSAGGGMTPRNTLTTEIAIVDADLGDILWYHLGQTNENYTKEADPKPTEKLIEAILKPLPASKNPVQAEVTMDAKPAAKDAQPVTIDTAAAAETASIAPAKTTTAPKTNFGAR